MATQKEKKEQTISIIKGNVEKKINNDQLISDIKQQIKEKDEQIYAMEKQGLEGLIADIKNVANAMSTAEGIRTVLSNDIMKQLTLEDAAGIAADVGFCLDVLVEKAENTDDIADLSNLCDNFYDPNFVKMQMNEPSSYWSFVAELVRLEFCRRFSKQGFDIASAVVRARNERESLEKNLANLEKTK